MSQRWDRWRIRALLVAVATVAGLVIPVLAPAWAQATALTEFSGGSVDSPAAIVPGIDGNLWFVEPHAIGRISPSGVITQFTAGLNPGSAPFDMTAGPDGNLWFSDSGTTRAIGEITTQGVIHEFTGGLNPGSLPQYITAANGKIWFADLGTTKAVGQVTTAGAIHEFTPGLNPASMINAITVGPDENVWFTDQGSPKAIGRVKADGTIDEFSSGLNMDTFPNQITSGADRDLYFSDDGTPGAIGRVTTAGAITELTDGVQSGGQPDAITLGPDGNVWFIDQYGTQRAIGRVPRAPGTTITEFHNGLNDGLPDDIAVGADGNLWVPQDDAGSAMTPSVARITPAGVITEFTAGLNLTGGSDKDQITAGPDGNLWFTDDGTPSAIGRVALQIPATATTGAASAITTTSATVSGAVTALGAATKVTFQYGTTRSFGSTVAVATLPASDKASPASAALTRLPSGKVIYYRIVVNNGFGAASGAVETFTTKPAPAQTRTATVSNQRISLTIPSLQVCTASNRTLAVRLTSATIPKSRAAKLRLTSATFYIDRGVKHRRKKVVHPRHGKKRTVTVTVFTANAIAHRVPATPRLRLAHLRAGRHTLAVTVTYRKRVTRHHHRISVTVTKRLTAKFRVC
jgi:streptogramin lyase